MTLGKCLRTVRIIFRSLFLPLLLYILPILCKLVAYSPEPGNSIYRPGTSIHADVFDVVMTIFFPIVFFALVYGINSTDDPQTERFLSSYHPGRRMGKEKFIFTSYEFYAEAGALLFFTMVGNTDSMYGYICDTLFGGTDLPQKIALRYTRLLVSGVILAAEYIARRIILSKWYGAYGGVYAVEWGLHKKKRFFPLSFWYVGIVFIACFGFSALSTFYLPQIVIALQWPVGKYILYLFPIGGALILLGTVFRYLRALRIRAKFIRDLRSSCKRFGVNLSEIRHPYRSVFIPQRGADFTIVQNGRKYDCKLLAGIYRNAAVTFSENGTGTQQRDFYLLRFRLFSLVTDLFFGFEGSGGKILIVNPIPKKIYVSHHGCAPYLADTAEPLGDYTLYNATGFFGAMERQTLSHREESK